MELFYSCDINGSLLSLSPEESAHCVRVLRRHAGEAIDVVDGQGTLYHCRLVEASPKNATAEIISSESNWGSHPYKLTMAVCLTKNIERYEWFVEKAVEMGVDVVVPLVGDHSERKVVKKDRLERIVVSAAKQSLKASFPQVSDPVSVHDFIDSAPVDALKLIPYCLEGSKLSMAEALGDCPREVVAMIGPEGDFSPAEVSYALEHDFRPVHLGQFRLRTETAALAVVAAVYLKFSQPCT